MSARLCICGLIEALLLFASDVTPIEQQHNNNHRFTGQPAVAGTYS